MTRKSPGMRSRQGWYDRHESVGPCSRTTAGPAGSPCSSHSSVRPAATVTLGMSGKSSPASSAKSRLEPRVVAHGNQVVVSARILAEPWEQLDRPTKVRERVVARVARKRCEARVVVVQARIVRRLLEATADRCERIGVPLFAVSDHRLSVGLPRLAPVDPLVGLPGRRADGEDRPVPGCLALRPWPDEHECSGLGVDLLTVDLEGRVPVENDVQLLLARPGLVLLSAQGPVLGGRIGVDSERADSKGLAHRNISLAPLDVVELCRLPVRLAVHPITSV